MAVGFALTLVGTLGALDALGLSWLVPGSNSVNRTALSAISEHPGGAEVLLVGSSRFNAGFYGERISDVLEGELGRPVDVYKLGLQGMRPLLLYQVVRDVVRERPPSRLLVLGLEARYFFDTSPLDTSSAQGFVRFASWRDLVAFDPRQMRGHELESWMSIPFRGVRAAWLLEARDDPELLEPRAWLLAHCGDLDRSRTVGVAGVAAPDPARRRSVQRSEAPRPSDGPPEGDSEELRGFRGLDVAAFEALLDELESLDCRVLFVRPPLERSYDDERQALEALALRERIVPAIRERGFEYRDLVRDPFPIDIEWYRDKGSHLNVAGAERTSELLARLVLAPLLRELQSDAPE